MESNQNIYIFFKIKWVGELTGRLNGQYTLMGVILWKEFKILVLTEIFLCNPKHGIKKIGSILSCLWIPTFPPTC